MWIRHRGDLDWRMARDRRKLLGDWLVDRGGVLASFGELDVIGCSSFVPRVAIFRSKSVHDPC